MTATSLTERLLGARPKRGRRVTVEARLMPSLVVQVLVFAGSVVGALALGAGLLLVTGYDPIETYRTMVTSSVGSGTVLSATLEQTTPLILTGLAATVAYRMRIYTIGADGQLMVGAILASWVALRVGGGAGAEVVIPLALVAGAVGGIGWALVAGVLRAYRGTNEVISTLMLNFVAANAVTYLIVDTGSIWRDPTSAAQPQGRLLPADASLPLLYGQADIGILIACAVAVVVYCVLRRTRRGYEFSVVGDSPRTARYAGMSVARNVVLVFVLSGALAGLAGGVQVTSVTHALDPSSLDPGLGLGYTGIVVAALARFSVAATVPVAFFVAALLTSGPALELVSVPASVIVVLQGMILLLVGSGQFFLRYRVRFAGLGRSAS